MNIDIEALLAALSIIVLVIVPVLMMLIRDLTTLVKIWIKITEDGQITEDEFIEFVDQMGVILKLMLNLFYRRQLNGFIKTKKN